MWILKQKTKAKSHGTINQKVKAKTGLCTLLHIACGTTGFLLFVTILSGVVLASSTTHADDAGTDTVNLTVEIACTLATGGGSYSTSVNPGNYTRINGNAISTVCNDPNGYSLYAIGYSGDSYDTPTNTQMIGTGSIGNIATGTATTGNTSGWAMQVTPTTGSAPTITNGFDSANFHVVPETYTQVAKYTSTTASSSAIGASVDTKYQVYAAATQTAGTYTGKVKYTMVHPNTAPTPTPPPEMQNLAANQCTTTPTTVVDSRDGEEYEIQRLADGKCWMLDNLRLGGSSDISLTPADTNITSNFTLPASTTTGFTIDTTGFTQPAVNADYKNTTITSYGAGSGKIGNYYNYCAASAGTYCYPQDQGTGNATYDICPVGWRMPTGGDYQGGGVGDGEYFALGTALGLTFDEDLRGFTGTTYQTALSTPLSGYFGDGSALNQGYVGAFFSSSMSDGNDMYSLFVIPDSAHPTMPGSRPAGNSVRCVMDTPTMQNVTSDKLAQLMPNNGDSTTLLDERDGNDYQITKIKGEYWMTQNLRFTETSLTTDTSNVSTNKTLSYGDLTSGDSFTEPRIHNSGDTTTGVWYNFCAAGANESNACNNSGSYSGSYDICPKNWHLPTNSQFSGITSYKDAFSPVTGGYYNDGSLSNTGYGYWWSSTANNASSQYRLHYTGSSLITYNTNKYYGYYVRCVRSS